MTWPGRRELARCTETPNPTCPPTCSLIFPVIIFCIEFFSLRRRIHRCAAAHEETMLVGQQCADVCMCCAGTAVLLVYPLIHLLPTAWPSHRDDVRPGIIESSWRSALTLMLFDSFMVTSLGGRVAVLAFMFLVG